MDLNVEISNEEDEDFKVQSWQQLEGLKMVISMAGKFTKKQTKELGRSCTIY